MQGFEFATASRVRFGRGAVGEAGKAAAAFGRRAVVVCGSDPAGAAFLLDLLRVEGV